MRVTNPSPDSFYDKEYYSTSSTRKETLRKVREALSLVELKEGMRSQLRRVRKIIDKVKKRCQEKMKKEIKVAFVGCGKHS